MSARRGLFTGVDGDGTGASPQDTRLALAGILPTVGVLTGLTVTGSTSGPNMKYNVSAGASVCARGTIGTDGVYLVTNDGVVTVDSGAPAPSSGSRWDIVWIRARNTKDGFGDATSLPDINVTVGLAAASNPTKPYAANSGAGGSSVPSDALVLAEAAVGPNLATASAATLTRVARPTVPLGGTPKATSTAFYPATPALGDVVDDANRGPQRWNGSAWKSLSISSGSTSGITDTNGYATITHGLSATPSRVVAQNTGPVDGAHAWLIAFVDSLTSTTFRARFLTTTGSGTTQTLAVATSKSYALDWFAQP